MGDHDAPDHDAPDHDEPDHDASDPDEPDHDAPESEPDTPEPDTPEPDTPEADTPEAEESTSTAPDTVVSTAEQVAASYSDGGVTYQMGGDASSGGATSDCSHFVNDVLQRAGLDVSYVSTQEIASSPDFTEVDQNQAVAGDVIVQGGHMGIYTGEDDDSGHPLGIQMGNHGAQEAPWGPGGWFSSAGDLRFYRPNR